MNLLLMDGAVVMDYSGKIITYGAKLKKQELFLVMEQDILLQEEFQKLRMF
jgi:hypothetical protein